MDTPYIFYDYHMGMDHLVAAASLAPDVHFRRLGRESECLIACHRIQQPQTFLMPQGNALQESI